jgi:hypothetical protein
MPITYEIDQGSGILYERWSGEITRQEMEQHWVALVNDPKCHHGYLCFADMREASSAFTSSELWKAVDDYFRSAPKLNAITVALIVDNDQQEQAARKWIAIVPKTVIARIFYDGGRALMWLKGDRHLSRGDTHVICPKCG